MTLNIVLLSISLSIDALGIGASYGIRKIFLSPCSKIIIFMLSMAITSASLLMGRSLNLVMPPIAANAIGILVLISLGLWLLLQSFRQDKKPTVDSHNAITKSFIVKSLGITIQIIKTPVYCDMDKSHTIDHREAIYLALALSLDSFGVGIGSGASGLISVYIPIMAALSQIILLSLGVFLGQKMAFFSDIPEKVWTRISGILLILISIIRML